MQSMGASARSPACARAPIGVLVLVNAMIPRPAETPGEWWANTGWEEGPRRRRRDRRGTLVEFDVPTYFLHDVAAEVLASEDAEERPEAAIAFTQPRDIVSWPDVPTRVVAGREDRFFTAAVPKPGGPGPPGAPCRSMPGPGRAISMRAVPAGRALLTTSCHYLGLQQLPGRRR